MADNDARGRAEDDEVAAVVSPRSRIEPLFERTTIITSRNVRQYYSDPADNREAERELRALGFTITAISSVTISITGARQLFEEVFGVSLRRRTIKYPVARVRGHPRAGADAEVEASYFEVADEPIQVLQAPENLRPLIEGVALARPPVLFESPLPPLAPPGPYRYLNVPSEVAGVLRATRVHRIGYTGAGYYSGVRVGMIDTGHYLHPFFRLHGYRRDPVLLGPFATDPADDLVGHGTGESANIFATAPGARLRPIKGLFDPVGDINLAIASTPGLAQLQVLTNSWGYDVDFPGASLTDPYLIALEAAVASAVAQGIIVCFAAGNGHYGFPASHPDVLAVGGVHVNYDPNLPTLDLEASSYASSFDSSFYPGRHVPDFCGLVGREVAGEAPLIMLPVQPNSLLDLGNTGATDDGWGIFSGTSAACPQVAGVVALLLGYDPTLSYVDVREILRDSARDVTVGFSRMGDAAAPGPDPATGSGLVDAREAWATMMGL